MKLSLPRSFLDRASRKRARQIERARGGRGSGAGAAGFWGFGWETSEGGRGEKRE